jgi:hypothetical protein
MCRGRRDLSTAVRKGLFPNGVVNYRDNNHGGGGAGWSTLELGDLCEELKPAKFPIALLIDENGVHLQISVNLSRRV